VDTAAEGHTNVKEDHLLFLKTTSNIFIVRYKLTSSLIVSKVSSSYFLHV
jgi:hypothetical protein